MTSGAAAGLQRLLSAWTGFLLRRPRGVAALVVLVAAGCLVYAAENLGVNTDTAEMLSPELAFRQNRERLLEAFPRSQPGLLLVVDGSDPDAATRAALSLEEELQGHPLVRWVHRPGGAPFFRDHALLYRPVPALEGATRRLAPGSAGAPSLGDAARKADLSVLFRHLEHRLATEGPDSVRATLDELTRGIGAALQDRDYRASWERLLAGRGARARREIVQVEPVADYGTLLPVSRAMESVGAVVRDVEAAHAPRVRIRITGTAALEHEELRGVSRGAALASVFSLLLVTGILLAGLRSPGMVLATGITLLAGLAVTGAFAARAVGNLNMISLAFAVLYIGLGVDYAIHLVLRYRELLGDGLEKLEAIRESVLEVGPSLALCALTTAVAFFAFVPTRFRGVAELGLISGTAMFLALGVTLTLLPALLALLPAPAGSGGPREIHRRAAGVPFRKDRIIRRAALAAGLASLLLLTGARFDYNPNNLRDPASESVSTFRDLLASEGASPWSLTLLASDPAEARRTARELETLPPVSRVTTVESFLPEEQDRKRALLARIGQLLEPEAEVRIHRARRNETTLALLALLDRLAEVGTRGDAVPAPEPARFVELARRLVAGLQLQGEEEAESLLARMEDGAFGDLVATRERIRTLAAGAPLTVPDLPREVRERWVGRDGARRVEVAPAEDLSRQESLRTFVTRVREKVPTVTGLPVVYLEAADAVVGAFTNAFTAALVAIVLILLLLLRSVRDTAYILLPLILAGVATGGAAVLLGIPFNFANVIVLPLLFGLGVDNGIHLVSRVKRLPEGRHVLATSTSRAVVLSGLTTLLSFSSLAFTSHRGVAGMGKLLVVGVGLILVSTLVVLPAFLARRLEGRAPPA